MHLSTIRPILLNGHDDVESIEADFAIQILRQTVEKIRSADANDTGWPSMALAGTNTCIYVTGKCCGQTVDLVWWKA